MKIILTESGGREITLDSVVGIKLICESAKLVGVRSAREMEVYEELIDVP